MATTDTHDYAEDADGFRTPVPRRRRVGLLVIAGVGVAYASMLAARGNGWSPLAFLLIGAVSAPLLATLFARWMEPRRWTARLFALLLVGVLSFLLAKFSTRTAPGNAFKQAFNIPPPPGVTLLDARKQWYDGMDVLISFEASRNGIDSMLATGAYEDMSYQPVGIQKYLVRTYFLNPSPLMPPTLSQPHSWQFEMSKAPGEWVAINILWDASTGRGLIRHASH